MVTISNMQFEDVPDVFSIDKKCFSMPWSEEAFFDELKNPNAVTFIARNNCENNQIIGFINAHLIIDECYINNIAVDEKFRKQGIGFDLINKLIDFMKIKNAVFISLEVRKTNFNAIKLYEKAGFQLKGERRNFYEKPIENALIYTLFKE
ncbi:MAG: ribosomal protein S18-alanine N-acetyltransferase [Oscillospiraceae bacterium]